MCFFILAVVSIIFRIKFFIGQEFIFEWKLFFYGPMNVCILLVFDWMALFFFSTVCLISRGVFIFSTRYIKNEKFFRRFIFLVLRFVFRIWLLILRPNAIRILLGWDGLGVTSYLLVIFYQREKSFNAGIITMLTNRLGDVGLLVFIGIRLQFSGWSFIYFRNNQAFYFLPLVWILILVAITKRAQIPFSAWLPAAIAAPTPVSALVHSSTLVTAGVYLLIRINYLVLGSDFFVFFLILGSLTMTIAGLAAIKEIDMKKIIALSTLRQLGVIFFSLGLGTTIISFFHLVSHAYFKAILFLCAGRVIHRIKDYQDTRFIGGRDKFLPLSIRIFLVSNFRLCGIPFFSGFYSKDLILEIFFIRNINLLFFFLVCMATGLTVAYSWRITWIVFFRKTMIDACRLKQDIDFFIIVGILLLFSPSIFGGILISWNICSYRNVIFLPHWLKIIVFILIFFSRINPQKFFSRKKFLVDFLQFIWFLPFLFSRFLRKQRLKGRKKVFLLRDNGWNLRVFLLLFKNFSRKVFFYFRGPLNRNFIIRIFFIILFWLMV